MAELQQLENNFPNKNAKYEFNEFVKELQTDYPSIDSIDKDDKTNNRLVEVEDEYETDKTILNTDDGFLYEPEIKKRKKMQNINDLEGTTKKHHPKIITTLDSLPDISKKIFTSPKKRLDINQINSDPKKEIYKFGNYSRYYGYRNTNDFHDVRLDAFACNPNLFTDKSILDIGCNMGLITLAIAKDFNIKHITGIDIDKGLINRVMKTLGKQRKTFKGVDKKGEFPFNINFVHGNYVLRDEILLEIERCQFDTILCLSVTKWIHLNFNDSGLKLAFKRMFLQLNSGGQLILEAQPWDSYRQRKKLTPEILENFKSIRFHPKDFTDFLLGSEVGFSEVYTLQVPEHTIQGFRRPIQVFVKK